jgi:hypothetical protein
MDNRAERIACKPHHQPPALIPALPVLQALPPYGPDRPAALDAPIPNVNTHIFIDPHLAAPSALVPNIDPRTRVAIDPQVEAPHHFQGPHHLDHVAALGAPSAPVLNANPRTRVAIDPQLEAPRHFQGPRRLDHAAALGAPVPHIVPVTVPQTPAPRAIATRSLAQPIGPLWRQRLHHAEAEAQEILSLKRQNELMKDKEKRLVHFVIYHTVSSDPIELSPTC